jgi:LmbE family N-acetylglucosaminyl deacetylase
MTTQQVMQEIEQKLQAGLQSIQGKTILHTAPHHDDILLGYFPYALRNLAGNTNHVLYITRGANGVSDNYLAEYLSIQKEDVALLDYTTKRELKFRIREVESEKKWSLCAGDQVQIQHFRAEFYESFVASSKSGQAMDRDIQRLIDYLEIVQPDIITMLVDPVGIGPSTHHRSQQVLTAAIAQWQSQSKQQTASVEILGYRNVWSTFSLDEASMIVCVSQDELDKMESVFTQCFATQTTMFIVDDQMKNFAQEVTEIQKAQLVDLTMLLNQQGDLSDFPGIATLQSPKVSGHEKSEGVIFLQKLTVPELQ